MTVYADVLVALNILLTYILIVASRVICKAPTNKWAVMVSSVVGGISSLVIFYENGGVVFSCIYKIITACVIICIAFFPKSIKMFLKEFLAFFGANFLFGGSMFALEFTLHPDKILFCNGTIYFDINIAYLVASVLIIYGIFLVADYVINKHNAKGVKYQLEIAYNNKIVVVTALMDTGNSLTDGMTGRPVVIAELAAMSPLFSREEIQFFRSEDFENIPESLKKSFRLIPCKTVTEDSLLKAFIPDFVKIKNGNNNFVNNFCTIALTKKDLSQGVYRALLNNNIFDERRKNDEKLYV